MVDSALYDQRCRKVIEDLEHSPHINLEYQQVAPLEPRRSNVGNVVNEIFDKTGVRLPKGSYQYLFNSDDIQAVWRTSNEPLIVGEFCLIHIHESVTGDNFPPDDWTLSPREEEILGRLKVIDSEPELGSGSVTGLYVTEDSSFEVWFYDAGLHRLERLDLDYIEYLETVLMTKGTTGWQYLFADVQLDTTELHSTAVDLEVMLNTFSEIFPNYDYQPLRDRLEARR